MAADRAVVPEPGARWDRDSLFEALIEPRPLETRGRDPRALVRRVETAEQAREWLKVFDQFLPEDIPDQLADYLRYALLGVCLGFIERDLSPYVGEHLAIIPPLLDDIRAVYERVQAQGADVDVNEFRFRAFDYGVHKAYYLDWTLYMSREPY